MTAIRHFKFWQVWGGIFERFIRRFAHTHVNNVTNAFQVQLASKHIAYHIRVKLLCIRIRFGILMILYLLYADERPFPCTICSKCFFTACDLKRHSVSHTGLNIFIVLKTHASKITIWFYIRTGERPYTCVQCKKSFSQTSSLDRHKRAVHQRIGSHACSQCKKRFTTALSLKQHLIIHARATTKNSNWLSPFFDYFFILSNRIK